jgi:membrane protease YdiL (CAAX protease family)
MYTQTGNLGAPIVAHFTINLLNLNYIAKHELRA